MASHQYGKDDVEKDEKLLFIGSTVGDSVLLKAARVEEEVDDEDVEMALVATVVDSSNDIDMDEEDEATNGDRPVPELVAATGSGHLGGSSLFQRDLPIRTKRRLHAIGGARGIHVGPEYGCYSVTWVIEMASRPQKSDFNFNITTRIPGTTIGAAPFLQSTAILHVMTGSKRVMEPEPQAQGPTLPTQEEPSSPKPDGELGKKEAEQSQIIEQVLVAPVLLRSGQLAIYQALSYSPLSVTEPPQTPRASHLNVKFVKMISKTFSLNQHDGSGIVALAEQKKISRMFVPFVTKTDFLGLDGPSLLEWIPEFRLEGPLPKKSIPRGRAYSNIVFDPATSLIVAAASLEVKFALGQGFSRELIYIHHVASTTRN
ncbi:hypothetical protein K435DRAFT_858538 [Dendrothele bispora CBS 962.96]|uniref:Cleavage/polyadenylation specificity factor A subunit N-terminal domain-containing protein n=1 Tax=Dendrothele bispora (strain CBS 962.96) TaxID=1314807 RepID=A0A4S8M3E6_DENBC|nr:hypothetical protein K435DRAFT_858538 [Dendrothele bispora CBS 962.96]